MIKANAIRQAANALSGSVHTLSNFAIGEYCRKYFNVIVTRQQINQVLGTFEERVKHFAKPGTIHVAFELVDSCKGNRQLCLSFLDAAHALYTGETE